MGRVRDRMLAIALTLIGGACGATSELPSPSATSVSASAPPVPSASVAPVGAEERRTCEALRRSVEQAPALPGAPELESQRAFVLGRAKGSPVLFLRAPQRALTSPTPITQRLANQMSDPKMVFGALKTLRNWLPHQMPLVREVLMPQGYLYSELPDAAEWMELLFKLEHLFKEKELWLLRGSEIHRLTREDGTYRFAEGRDQGREASLLMFDRVALSRDDLLPALHVDLIPAMREFGFDRVRVERITAEGINVSLRYGSSEVWSRAVLTAEASRARVACEIVEDGLAATVLAFRAEARQKERILSKIREVVAWQVDENLPFDEPREEVGQQDGSLRPQWAWAYNHDSNFYSFNKISYSVFDAKGRPRTPQVCIDFVLDTFERASGTWYRGRKEARERVVGSIDFSQLQMPNRRGVESVVNYFREHPDLFEVWDLAAEERIRYRDRQHFLEYLANHADQFRPADVVVIHGPKGAENHYHSFLVFECDPVTGMPILLAGNAGKPRVRPWSAVMLSAPLRSIKNRMRPNWQWLAKALDSGTGEVSQAAGDRGKAGN